VKSSLLLFSLTLCLLHILFYFPSPDNCQKNKGMVQSCDRVEHIVLSHFHSSFTTCLSPPTTFSYHVTLSHLHHLSFSYSLPSSISFSVLSSVLISYPVSLSHLIPSPSPIPLFLLSPPPIPSLSPILPPSSISFFYLSSLFFPLY
jgi:hypothetical protein